MSADSDSLEALVAQVADKPALMARLASVLMAQGNAVRARELCECALALAPRDGEVRVLASEVFAKDVPPWFFFQANDTERHAAYGSALQRHIQPGDLVLDIGSGTGMFAMLAARTGARVVSCEKNARLALVVERVIAQNGLADRIRVVPKRSFDLEIGVELDRRADVIVWDNLANTLVGANALATIEDAARRLGRSGARIIPAGGIIRVALVEDLEPWLGRIGMMDGFDMSEFNRHAPARRQMTAAANDRYVVRSDPVDLFSFDFQSGGPFPQARASAKLRSRGGRVDGVVQWAPLLLDEIASFENAPPMSPTKAMGAIFHPFIRPVETTADENVTVLGSHDRQNLRIWADVPA